MYHLLPSFPGIILAEVKDWDNCILCVWRGGGGGVNIDAIFFHVRSFLVRRLITVWLIKLA